jgi:hypothetical protein
MALKAMAFMLIYGLGVLSAFFLDPAYGVYTYMFVYFLYSKNRYWSSDVPALQYSLIISLVLAASYMVRYKTYSKNKIFDAPQTKWLLLFGIIMLLTWPIAVDHAERTKWMVLYWKYILLYIIIVKTIDSPWKFEGLIGSFLMGAFYWGYLCKFIGRDSEGRVENVGGSDGNDANTTAAVIVAAVPFLMYYLLRGKMWQKLLALFALAFVLNALILINSRGAFLALVISTSYYLFLFMRTKTVTKFMKAAIMLIAAFVFGLFILLSDDVFWDRMGTLETSIDASVSQEGHVERTYYWFKTFDVLQDYPLGVGPRGYEWLSSQYIPKAFLSRTTNTRAVHSTYFEVLSEYGVHGLFLFIGIIVATFRYSGRLKKALLKEGRYEPYFMAISLESALLAFLVAAGFIDRLYAEVFYWLIGFIAVFGNCYNAGSGDATEIKAV